MTDNSNEILCPACNKPMQKVFINNAKFNVDVCSDSCGGIYIDNRELKSLDEQNENIDEMLEILKDKKFKRVDTSETRFCPVCRQKMVKHFLSVKHEIEIDDCYACGGKFFDNEELQKMRQQYKTESERSEAVVAYLYSVAGEELKEADKVSEPREKSSIRKLYDLIFGL